MPFFCRSHDHRRCYEVSQLMQAIYEVETAVIGCRYSTWIYRDNKCNCV